MRNCPLACELNDIVDALIFGRSLLYMFASWSLCLNKIESGFIILGNDKIVHLTMLIMIKHRAPPKVGFLGKVANDLVIDKSFGLPVPLIVVVAL